MFHDCSGTILDAFDEETGKPYHYKIVKKWPCLLYLPSANKDRLFSQSVTKYFCFIFKALSKLSGDKIPIFGIDTGFILDKAEYWTVKAVKKSFESRSFNI